MRIKTIIILLTFLVVTLIPQDLTAKTKKRGVELTVLKTDGTTIEGELLNVKNNSLLIMDHKTQTGISISMDAVCSITIHKKLKAQYIWLGFLAGAIYSKAWLQKNGGWEENETGVQYIFMGLGGLLGSGIGAILGGLKGIDTKIKTQTIPALGMPRILKKLNSLAKFPEPFIPVPTGSAGEDDKSAKSVDYNPPFLHVAVVSGKFKSNWAKDYEPVVGRSVWRDGFNVEEMHILPDRSPYLNAVKDIRIEVKVGRKWGLGASYSPLEYHESYWGTYLFREKDYGYSSIHIGRKGSTTLLTCTYSLLLDDPFLNPYSLKLGAGIGMSQIQSSYSHSEFEPGSTDHWLDPNEIILKKNMPSAAVFADFSYYFSRNISLGVLVDYKYIPASFDEIALNVRYYSWNSIPEDITTRVNIPAHKINYGGLGLGISCGFHF